MRQLLRGSKVYVRYLSVGIIISVLIWAGFFFMGERLLSIFL